VVLVFPTGEVSEFSTVESAWAYLTSARRVGAQGAGEATLYSFEEGQWYRLS
jgi:hypothetical protein